MLSNHEWGSKLLYPIGMQYYTQKYPHDLYYSKMSLQHWNVC